MSSLEPFYIHLHLPDERHALSMGLCFSTSFSTPQFFMEWLDTQKNFIQEVELMEEFRILMHDWIFCLFEPMHQYN